MYPNIFHFSYLLMILIFISKHNDLIQLQKTMNRELNKVRKWLDANRLSLNTDKINFVVFHSPQINLVKPVVIRFSKKKIKRQSFVKFLGIMLDANLSWKYHIAELSIKLSRATGMFYKIRHLVSLEILKILYYSLFYLFISNGITAWGYTHKTYVQNIFLQNKNVRVMTFVSRIDHSDPIFANLEFLKFNGIRQLQLLSFVYDCQNKLAPDEYFVPCSQVHRFSTRLALRGDLFLERKNTFQYGIQSITFTGAGLWNMLPVPLRESTSAAIFRAELIKHLLSSYSASS